MCEVKENELVNVGMQIILHAGDARMHTEEALKSVKIFDFNRAETLMKEAKECIRKAHIAQTGIIQNEARGTTYEPSLLFTHAQDTLMTINSEVILAGEMIDLFKILNHKLDKIGGTP